MSTWTCKVHRRIRRRGLAATLALSLTGVLSGCIDGHQKDGGLSRDPQNFAAQQVLSGASLFNGDVIIRTPPGYCVDGDSLRARGTSFALIAACPLLQGRPDSAADPVLITVTGQPHDGPLPNVTAMVATMQPARAIEAIAGDELTIVHLLGGTPGPLADGDARHWRAVMLVNGHLLSLALFAPDGSPLADRAGLGLLGALADAIRKASPTRTTAAPAAASAASRENAATPARKAGNGLLGRLSLARKSG